jgi:hypothetical protein
MSAVGPGIDLISDKRRSAYRAAGFGRPTGSASARRC